MYDCVGVDTIVISIVYKDFDFEKEVVISKTPPTRTMYTCNILIITNLRCRSTPAFLALDM